MARAWAARSPARRRRSAENSRGVDGSTLWQAVVSALALMLVIEGLLPFLSPRIWRQVFEQILKLGDGQIRFFGLCSMLAGLLTLGLIVVFG